MPYVKIQIIEGRSPEQKQKVAQSVTQALTEHMGILPDHTYVVFEDVAATDWIIGGETVAERITKRAQNS